jgi:hypothetical protein
MCTRRMKVAMDMQWDHVAFLGKRSINAKRVEGDTRRLKAECEVGKS